MNDIATVTSKEWESFFKNDSVESVQKMLHLLTEPQHEMIFKLAMDNGSLKVSRYFANQSKFQSKLNEFLNQSIRTTKSLEILKVLINACKNVDFEYIKTSFERKELFPIVKHLLENRKIIFSDIDSDGRNGLLIASSVGNLQTVKYLVESGSNINQTDTSGQTGLFISCYNKKFEVVKFLVENGALLHLANMSGNSPIWIATHQGQLDVLAYLFEKGANPNLPNKLNETCLHIASFQGHYEIVKYLVEVAHVPLDSRDSSGQTPLFLAIKFDEMKIVKYLISQGSSIQTADESGNSLLHIAANQGQLEMVMFLFESGANPNFPNKLNETCLHIASFQGHYEIVKYLVEVAHVPVNSRDNFGQSATFSALKSKHMEIVKYLISISENKNTTT